MTTQLSDLIPALKRELAVPGTFATIFPDTTDSDLLGALADAFAEAQLFGRFFAENTLTYTDATPGPEEYTVDPEISGAAGAIVVIYASMRFIRAQLRNIRTSERYKAGPVEFEVATAATLLTAELDFLRERLRDIISNADSTPINAVQYDNYLARGGLCVGGFYSHEYH